jgi:hypothetical protein
MSYLDELMAAVKTLPVAFYVAKILHDADCPRPRGGDCTCDAEIEIQQPESF